MTAALKARAVSEFATSCLAIELLAAAQAVDFRGPKKPGRGVLAAHQLIRARVPHMDRDRELHKDIASVAALVQSGELVAAVRRACYDAAA